MLDKFSISLTYHVNGNKKAIESKELETDDYVITERIKDADRLVLDFEPKSDKSITIDDFTITYHYDYLPRYKQFQRIFANGYQSWTASREYFPDEHSPVFKGKKIMGYVGDYAFTTDSKERGRFRSVSYTYIRNNDDFELFGSLNESTGYTIFYYDVIAKKFRVAKDLAGVTFESGEPYEIMNISRYRYDGQVAFDKWFSDMEIPKPRVTQANGYTTWYNYYANINQNIIERDLESIASLDAKIDIFQIDDGYETCVGDWTSIKKGFGDMNEIVSSIHDKGLKAGIWLAPFAVSAKSKLFKEHKDWLVKDGKKLFLAGKNWGGFFTLDIYNPEVVNYLNELFSTILDDWGFDMVKLDHLYQACIIPYNNKTRGAIMTDAMNLLRELCGDKLMLATGVPLYPAFGKADMCRIGPDMGLKWDSKKKGFLERVSTTGALNNTIFRHHLNGRAFANDPDVFLLRDNNMKMTPGQRRIVATINKVFGDVLFTSDNVAKYKKDWQKELLLDMFNDDDMKIMGAEYVTNNILHIKCFKGNTPTLITIDMKQGVMLKQEVDASELKVTDIDDRLTHRGGSDYHNVLSSEDDNYDDFDLDRELTPEEIAENEEKKRKLQIAKEKRRQELIATKMAEREAKKVAKAMKKKASLQDNSEEVVEEATEEVTTSTPAETVETPAVETPVEEVAETPVVEETPVEEVVEEAPVVEEEAPVEEVADETPVEEEPTEDVVPEAPVEEVAKPAPKKPRVPKTPKPTKAPKVKKTDAE